MTEEEVNGRVPKELLPKCPKCGGDMEVNWGEMSSFTETKNWKEKAARYQEFIQNLHGKEAGNSGIWHWLEKSDD